MGFEDKRRGLVAMLLRAGVFHSPQVKRALLAVPREEFLTEATREAAYIDSPLPIHACQTISAPHMVAMMCEVLELGEGLRVLEVGAGSGYHAAVVAEIVAPTGAGKKGHVYTVELHRELAEFAGENLRKTGYGDRVTVVEGDGSLGLSREAPFDRVLVTASSPSIPPPLIEQLAVGGLIAIPLGSPYSFQELVVVRKRAQGRLEQQRVCEVAFVPLKGRYGWRD